MCPPLPGLDLETSCRSSMAEWLEREVVVREVSVSSPGWGRHKKNLYGCREPSDYVIFCRAVKRQWFHTHNTHDTKPITTLLTNALRVVTGSRSVPTRWPSLISSRMTNSVICCMSEKKVSSYKLHMTPSVYDIKVSTIGSQMEVKP